MEDLQESQAAAEASPPEAAAPVPASLERKHPEGVNQGRRVLFLLLTLGGLVWAVMAQAQLGEYSRSGGGAAQVTVPPLLVAFSVVSCACVAVVLSLHDWRKKKDRTRTASWPAVQPE